MGHDPLCQLSCTFESCALRVNAEKICQWYRHKAYKHITFLLKIFSAFGNVGCSGGFFSVKLMT